ncbi:integrase [Streptomyces nodosus]|nr:integrase [Streptomyces nodosus]
MPVDGASHQRAASVRAAQAKNYADSIEMTFRMIMGDAVVEGLFGVNPVPAQSRRRGRYEPEDSAEDTYVYPDPVQALLLADNARVIRGLIGEVMILVMAYTGMRIAEIAGLRREFCWVGPDRDPWDQHIRVEHQGHYLKGGFKLHPPKYSSYRTLILPPFLGDLLWKVLESHEAERLPGRARQADPRR